MCLKPVYLGSANRAVSQPYRRSAFHLSPMRRSVSPIQVAADMYTPPGGNCLNVLDFAQYLQFHPSLSEIV